MIRQINSQTEMTWKNEAGSS